MRRCHCFALLRIRPAFSLPGCTLVQHLRGAALGCRTCVGPWDGSCLLWFVSGLLGPGLGMRAFSREVIPLSLGLPLTLFYHLNDNCNHQLGNGETEHYLTQLKFAAGDFFFNTVMHSNIFNGVIPTNWFPKPLSFS